MHLTPADKKRITGSFSAVREPARPDVAAQSDDTDGLARYCLQVTSRDRTSSDAVRCAAHKYAA